MCLLVNALCTSCHCVTDKSRRNPCFETNCTPEKITRFVSRYELVDFVCWTRGCKYNDGFYLRQWIEYHYKGRHEQLEQRLIPLVVAEFKRRAESQQRASLEAGVHSMEGESTNGSGESSRDGKFSK